MRWILLVSLIISITALPAIAQTPPEGRNQIITTGTGRVDVTPDQVTVTVGVQVQRRGAADAWAEASLVANQMLARFQQLGVRKEQLKTSGIRLFPVYSALQGTEPQITGYRAAYNLMLTLDDLNLVGRVIDAGMESGANLLGGVSFGLRDPSTARRQALAMAVREAQEKANTIAQAAGLQIRGIERIVEGGGTIQGRVSGTAPEVGRATPIEAGTVSVTAEVTAVYSY